MDAIWNRVFPLFCSFAFKRTIFGFSLLIALYAQLYTARMVYIVIVDERNKQMRKKPKKCGNKKSAGKRRNSSSSRSQNRDDNKNSCLLCLSLFRLCLI